MCPWFICAYRSGKFAAKFPYLSVFTQVAGHDEGIVKTTFPQGFLWRNMRETRGHDTVDGRHPAPLGCIKPWKLWGKR